jgi:DNA-binding NtrC family response regulator
LKRFLDDVEARLLAEREAALARTPPAALEEAPQRDEEQEEAARRRCKVTTDVRNAILRAPQQMRTTMDEIARRLQVSRRTVLRVLKAAGKSPGQGRRLGVESW